MKENIEKLIIVILIVIFSGVLIVKGIVTLSLKDDTVTLEQLYDDDSKGTYVEGDVFVCLGECFAVTHRINFIPLGKDYYYLVYNESMTKYIVVRAGKDWDGNFGTDGMNWSGVHIKGVVRDLNYHISSYINENEQMLSNIGNSAEAANCYIDLLSDRYAILSLICGVLLLVCSVLVAVYIKSAQKTKYANNSWIGILIIVILFIDICLSFHIMAMTW